MERCLERPLSSLGTKILIFRTQSYYLMENADQRSFFFHWAAFTGRLQNNLFFFRFFRTDTIAWRINAWRTKWDTSMNNTSLILVLDTSDSGPSENQARTNSTCTLSCRYCVSQWCWRKLFAFCSFSLPWGALSPVLGRRTAIGRLVLLQAL